MNSLTTLQNDPPLAFTVLIITLVMAWAIFLMVDDFLTSKRTYRMPPKATRQHSVDIEINKKLTFAQRIKVWNNERGLLGQPLDYNRELHNIVEEVIEFTCDAKPHVQKVFTDNISEQLLQFGVGIYSTTDQRVDALCDIMVLANGTLLKMGYDPDVAMDETLKQISSRKGEIVDGKFMKFTDPEKTKDWYIADYDKARLNV